MVKVYFLTSLWFLAMVAMAKGEGSTQCPSGLRPRQPSVHGTNGNCYVRMPTAKNFTAAEDNCRVQGGHLASIASDNENNIVRNLSNTQIWIGLNDRAKESTFVWTDSSPYNYEMWDQYENDMEPNNANGREWRANCVRMMPSGKWRDTTCSDELAYVCEISAQTATTQAPMTAGSYKHVTHPTTLAPMLNSTANVSESKRSSDSESSAAAVGGGVAAACIAIVIVCVLVVLALYRRRKTHTNGQSEESNARNGAVQLANLNYTGQSSDIPQKRGSNFNGTTTNGRQTDELHADSQRAVRVNSSQYAYAATFVEGLSQARNGSHVYDGEENRLPGRLQEQSSDVLYEEIYWQPAKSVEKLYAQFDGKRFRRILRSEILIHETIGSGEFGTVAKGTWRGSGGGITVAVKMLNSPSDDDRVRFLQEGAIMGQFKHTNIVFLRGLVLEEEPLMIALEFMDNGDLKQYLQTLRRKKTSCAASRLLKMAREIAAGMKYLARKAFIHRDLAVRNVMLDRDFTCKIGDFGLSRDLTDNDYYITHGGRIPVRWTAPEAVMYRKYSTSSDIWSYGIVLHEIWTLGKRPYDNSWSNNYVIEIVDEGYRLSPPPGCSHVIYDMMINCWHPDRHQRPSFEDIVRELGKSDDELLVNDPSVEEIRGNLGDDMDRAAGLYADLQSAYNGIAITK